MSGKKIYILAEGGGTKGMGHISRCLSLCQAFKKYGSDAVMIVDGEELLSKTFEETNVEAENYINRKSK